MTAPEDVVGVGIDEMAAFGAAILAAHGAAPAAAARVMEHLVDSSLCGVHSHGVMRIPEYVRLLQTGEIDGDGEPKVDERDFPTIEIRGRRTFGQLVAALAVELALVATRRSRVVLVLLRDGGHVGRVGAYVERLAAGGVPAIAFCSSAPSRDGRHLVAPWGGREGRLGTHPIAYGVPIAGGPPIVADFSTAALAEGRVRWLRNTGRAAPPGVLRDADGHLTSDPSALYGSPPGTIQPLGGEHGGHKGFALGILVELAATLIGGVNPLDFSRTGNTMALLAFAADTDLPVRARAYADWLRASPPVPGGAGVELPGDRERAARDRASVVEVDGDTWRELSSLADRVDVRVPSTVGLQSVDKLQREWQ